MVSIRFLIIFLPGKLQVVSVTMTDRLGSQVQSLGKTFVGSVDPGSGNVLEEFLTVQVEPEEVIDSDTLQSSAVCPGLVLVQQTLSVVCQTMGATEDYDQVLDIVQKLPGLVDSLMLLSSESFQANCSWRQGRGLGEVI